MGRGLTHNSVLGAAGDTCVCCTQGSRCSPTQNLNVVLPWVTGLNGGIRDLCLNKWKQMLGSWCSGHREMSRHPRLCCDKWKEGCTYSLFLPSASCGSLTILPRCFHCSKEKEEIFHLKYSTKYKQVLLQTLESEGRRFFKERTGGSVDWGHQDVLGSLMSAGTQW